MATGEAGEHGLCEGHEGVMLDAGPRQHHARGAVVARHKLVHDLRGQARQAAQRGYQGLP